MGEFDGVHIGHREVIRGADTVLTFEPHPRAVVAPDSAPKLLTPLAVKADLIADLGVRELVVIPFDGSFAAQTAQEFIDHVLVERLGARTVSVGENFRFGNRAKGDTELLRAQDAFATRVAELVEVDGEIVSSTPHPRARLGRRGRRRAARFLGAPFQMRGTVAHGDKRGRTLGFPTANLVPDSALVVPDHGIYACRAAGRRRAPDRRRQRRRAADVPDRPRPARRGVPARLRRRPLRPASCGSSSSSACAARSASTPSTRSWSRCTATSTRPAASPLDSLTKVRDMDADRAGPLIQPRR